MAFFVLDGILTLAVQGLTAPCCRQLCEGGVPKHEATASEQAFRWRLRIVAVVAVALLIGLSAWRAMRPSRAIEGLPAAERRALYDRTIESLATVCRSHQVGLADFCRDQAELVVRFPECDATCRAVADPHLPRGSR
ncbi:MAG: hypothetical protein IPH72_35195 [Sandaracinaceae bacterium]|nr:hypothetical protein [Sandaracinaceae bacterium]